MAFSPVTYLKESYAELRKVSWPTRQQAINNTVVVICFTFAVALFLGLVDFVLNEGLNYLIDFVQ